MKLEYYNKSLNLYGESLENGLSINGKDPKDFAASAIYMAAKPTSHRKTQSKVSDIAKITEVTFSYKMSYTNFDNYFK
ncbi:MAG: hypothetical protein ACFFC3_08625 [Candidatus Odinarchaeota archaeon]